MCVVVRTSDRRKIVPRSLHKGPFVDLHLATKVQQAVESNDKRPIKTWSRRSLITPDFVGLPFRCITAGSMSLYSSVKTWSGTSWVNLRSPALSAATLQIKKPRKAAKSPVLGGRVLCGRLVFSGWPSKLIVQCSSCIPSVFAHGAGIVTLSRLPWLNV